MCILIYFAQSSFLAMVEIAKVEICEEVWTRKDSKSLAQSSVENLRKAEIRGYMGKARFDICVYFYDNRSTFQ